MGCMKWFKSICPPQRAAWQGTPSAGRREGEKEAARSRHSVSVHLLSSHRSQGFPVYLLKQLSISFLGKTTPVALRYAC